LQKERKNDNNKKIVRPPLLPPVAGVEWFLSGGCDTDRFSLQSIELFRRSSNSRSRLVLA
jgi:hypothetical protein